MVITHDVMMMSLGVASSTHTARPGVELPVKLHTTGDELN